MSYRDRMAKVYDRRVPPVIEKKVRATSLFLLADLKMNTPVDTGHARSNWHLDIGQPSVRLVAPNQDLAPDLSSYTIDQTIFITNNVPYIRKLNEGHSAQAPAGFVEASAMRARRYSKQVK